MNGISHPAGNVPVRCCALMVVGFILRPIASCFRPGFAACGSRFDSVFRFTGVNRIHRIGAETGLFAACRLMDETVRAMRHVHPGI